MRQRRFISENFPQNKIDECEDEKMKKFTLTMMTLGLVATLGLAGCGKQEKKATTSSEKTEVTLPTKDRSGKEITLPKEATKIISLVPSTTEVIEDLGKTDQLIAVDTQSSTMMTDLKKLPQMDMMAVDAEKLIALKPQIVYVNDINLASSESVWKQVEDAGITVVNIPTSTSIKAIKEDVQFIADSLSEHEKGQKLIKTMDQEIDEVAKIGKTIKKPKTVLFEVAALPDIYSFGNGTFLNEMIETIGAKNVLANEKGWLPVTEEAAIAAKPEVILTNVNYMKDPAKEILARKNWENVPAVQNKEVFEIDNMSSSLPNNHITKALKQMAKAVYPEEYKDLKDE
ncbi:ABC transporter substrate-binding protein [Enterococcus faecalis]|uniref:ABC transporter substrate-binding protein n=1 Tax=Enterococcus TaxID=1350 RepID=UPI00019F33E4|nr:MULTISPECIES: ABC transporter substrate-binding protein [Enterococcus]MDR4029350.1 ABC transporter substrate-binding protein [Enterococcus sp.]AEA94041.1 iron (Fe) ABC superfamily ATP binding cassette transporter, binding protein [Enterococcus faecalis OG1RF]APC55921.2 ABC transporter substrate-binding protein [Enterococcus faecalis]EEN70846.1 periplasmic binding protein [Enterococcus faecalis ATCC 29200]EEN75047.1 periplasmic binding protein [Enterococcus faecalis TX1322]